MYIEWYVVRCGFKNGHQKDTCLTEIEPCVQKLLTLLGSAVDMIGEEGGRTYMTT